MRTSRLDRYANHRRLLGGGQFVDFMDVAISMVRFEITPRLRAWTTCNWLMISGLQCVDSANLVNLVYAKAMRVGREFVILLAD